VTIFDANAIRMKRITHMTDIYIFLRLCVLVLVQVVCFVVWYLVDKPSVFSKSMSLDIANFQYVVHECKSTSRNAEIILWVYNGGVLLNLVRLTVSARNIPRRFNEVQVMGLISYFCIFFIIVLVPALQFLEDAKTNYVIFVSMVFILVTTSGFLHTLPKLYQRNLTSKDLDGEATHTFKSAADKAKSKIGMKSGVLPGVKSTIKEICLICKEFFQQMTVSECKCAPKYEVIS
jgi:hypothetical protein